ncbi:MAG: AtpZ/AtpI family protein [Pseudomonadales bacterium]|nr:AtpZ/AtpI family protein [Pseudomonadales bacterium]
MMNTEHREQSPSGREQQNFVDKIGVQVARKLKARRDRSSGLWFGLGMMGLIGWSVVVPTLLGTGLGIWIDKHHADEHSWTLALLMAGLTLGCLHAWLWIAREDRVMHEDEDDKHD